MFLAYASRSRLTAYQAGSPSPDLSTPASAASPAGTQAIIRMTYGSSIVKELIHYYYSSGGDSGDAKGKEKEKKPKPTGGGQKSQTERLKTVVRRLPPNLPEEIFWQSVAKWVTDETVTWKTYYPGKFKTRCVVVRRLRACSRKLKHEACRASAG